MKMTPEQSRLAYSTGLLILRLSFRGYMMVHDWGKLQMVLEGKLDQFGGSPRWCSLLPS